MNCSIQANGCYSAACGYRSGYMLNNAKPDVFHPALHYFKNSRILTRMQLNPSNLPV